MARPIRWLVVLWVATLTCGAHQERAPGVQRLRFEIEVDLERARAVGWTAPDEADVVALAAGVVRERLLAMGREVRVEVQPGTKRFHLTLPSIDARDSERIQGLVRSLGVCELLFAADEEEAHERPKIADWRRGHPTAPLEELNQLAPSAGGPPDGFAWFETLDMEGGKPTRHEPALLRFSPEFADHFGATDFERSYVVQDLYGYPAIGFELVPTRADDFARVTGAHLNVRMAIVLEGSVRSAPVLNSKLRDRGLIEGRFSSAEAERLTSAINAVTGPLRVVEAR